MLYVDITRQIGIRRFKNLVLFVQDKKVPKQQRVTCVCIVYVLPMFVQELHHATLIKIP